MKQSDVILCMQRFDSLFKALITRPYESFIGDKLYPHIFTDFCSVATFGLYMDETHIQRQNRAYIYAKILGNAELSGVIE